MRSFLESWQADYESATGKTGKVKDVFGRIGRMGGLAIWVEVEEGGETVYYSPYLNSSPFDGCGAHDDGSCMEDESAEEFCDGHQFEFDEAAWIDSMTGATDWDQWDWGESTPHLLDH